MKKGLLIATLATGMIALTACGNETDTVVGKDSPIVTTDLGDITVMDFYDAIRTQSATSNFLQQMVVEKVFLDKFEVSDEDLRERVDSLKGQFGDADAFETALQQAGFENEAAFKESLTGSIAIEKAIKAEITDEQLKEAVTELEEIEASHILVEDEETAKEIKEKLDNGADFAELAKEFSTDTSNSENGGELGFFGRGRMVAEFEEAAFALEVGEISGPVETNFGFHIIKLTDKNMPVFEELTDEELAQLKDVVLNNKYQDGTAQEIINEALRAANVQVKDSTFQDLFDF